MVLSEPLENTGKSGEKVRKLEDIYEEKSG
jgi:hypothetical protein